jgi:hypothetical protein
MTPKKRHTNHIPRVLMLTGALLAASPAIAAEESENPEPEPEYTPEQEEGS